MILCHDGYTSYVRCIDAKMGINDNLTPYGLLSLGKYTPSWRIILFEDGDKLLHQG